MAHFWRFVTALFDKKKNIGAAVSKQGYEEICIFLAFYVVTLKVNFSLRLASPGFSLLWLEVYAKSVKIKPLFLGAVAGVFCSAKY